MPTRSQSGILPTAYVRLVEEVEQVVPTEGNVNKKDSWKRLKPDHHRVSSALLKHHIGARELTTSGAGVFSCEMGIGGAVAH